jgi:hypothetical protein
MKLLTKFILFFNLLFISKQITPFFIQLPEKAQIQSLVSKLYNKINDIQHIELKIINPKKNNNILNLNKYSLKILIITDDKTYLKKTIEENDYDKLLNKTEEFILQYSISLIN